MEVKLLAYTPQPEKTVACAAKLCYAAADIDTVYEGLTEEKTASFLEMLSSIGHESPIEHASFTFGIQGVSRSLLAQITRHRIASYSVQSQRYVKENAFEFVLPPEIEAIPAAKEEFLRAMEEDQKHYENLTALLKEKHKRELLAQGEDEKSANRKAEKEGHRGRPLRAAQRLRHQDDLHHERPVPPQLLHPPVLQPGPVGDPGPGGGDAQRGEGRGAPYLREGRPPLPAGELSRGQDELRKDEGGPGKVRVPVTFPGPWTILERKGGLLWA